MVWNAAWLCPLIVRETGWKGQHYDTTPPSAARSASGPSPRGDMGGGGNVTIVLSSLVPPGPRELQGLVHAQRQAGRYGLGDARMVPRQVRA